MCYYETLASSIDTIYVAHANGHLHSHYNLLLTQRYFWGLAEWLIAAILKRIAGYVGIPCGFESYIPLPYTYVGHDINIT